MLRPIADLAARGPAVLRTEPISRLTLALYCGASGDHNPIHVDSDFARAAGYPDVFAHGMLPMAYLARMLTDWVPPEALRSLRVRFTAITRLGEVLVCRGELLPDASTGEGGSLRVKLTAVAEETGEVKLVGEALVDRHLALRGMASNG